MPTFDSKEQVMLRPYAADDKNFILSTWLKGLYYGSVYHAQIDKTAFFKNYHDIIEKLLEKSVVMVACLRIDEGAIVAYSVLGGTIEAPVLHWIHCKKPWRGIGVAKSLIPANTQTVTHITKVGSSILKKHPAVKFNPFAI